MGPHQLSDQQRLLKMMVRMVLNAQTARGNHLSHDFWVRQRRLLELLHEQLRRSRVSEKPLTVDAPPTRHS